MGRRIAKLGTIASLIRAGHYDEAGKHLRRWQRSDFLFYGLRRDLAQPFEVPSAKIPLTVRPMREGDIPALVDIHTPGTTDQGIYERMNRLEFIRAGIPTCYLAVAPDDQPCYMQFLIGPRENAKLRAYLGGLFPPLAPDEACWSTPLPWNPSRTWASCRTLWRR